MNQSRAEEITLREECVVVSASEPASSQEKGTNAHPRRPVSNHNHNVGNNSSSMSSRGYHNQYHNNQNYYNNNGYNNHRYHNKSNYYHHHGGNYHHQSNRRYNNYHHYQNNNTYGGYNNNHYYSNSHYYGNNNYYNQYNYAHPTFNHATLTLPQPAVATSPTLTSQAPLSSNSLAPVASPSPTLPLKLNTFMDYWPSTSALSDLADIDSFASEGPSSIESHGSGNSYFSFQSRRSYNGYNSSTKTCPNSSVGKSNSSLPTWSSNSITPAHLKLSEGCKLDKEYDITQRGRFYIDGFPSLAAHKVDPDELVKCFKFGEVLERPLGLTSDDDYALLSEQVWEKFTENQQTTETFRKKMELWRDLAQTLRRHYRHYGLQVVGSTMSGFGSNTSDVDMCLLVRRVEIDQQSEAVDFLHQFWAAMGTPSFLDKIEMVYAKIPLLKCRDSVRNLEVDLNCNNYVGIRNTQLLYFYAQQDWRLKPLALVVKLWAKFHDINDAKAMTISSYSLVLMVIHFLQCGVSPPVLPCLHKVFPEKFMFQPDIIQVKQYMNETIRTEPSKNTQSLGELLLKFFEYYAIQFECSAISVRQGGVVSIKSCQANRSAKNDAHQWKHLCIEEPFDHTNTARSVYDRDTWDRIRGIFFSSWQRLYLTRNLTSVFSRISHYEAREIGLRVRT